MYYNILLSKTKRKQTHCYYYQYQFCGWSKTVCKISTSWHEASNKIRHSIFHKVLKFIFGNKFGCVAIAPSGTAKNEQIF